MIVLCVSEFRARAQPVRMCVTRTVLCLRACVRDRVRASVCLPTLEGVSVRPYSKIKLPLARAGCKKKKG